MTPRELILSIASRFEAAGIPDPANDAALLLSHLTGKAPLVLRLDTDTILEQGVVSSFLTLSERRMERIPLQYILGKAPFFGRMFSVDSRVLIPRPETELLCEWALEILHGIAHPRVLDLCCGSGIIGLTVKAEYPPAAVTLSDISQDALDVAADNAARLSQNVTLCLSDLLEAFPPSSFDLIISNPPYIPSCECSCLQAEVLHEPRLALDGGTDGCAVYRRIIESAGAVLSGGGSLLMELGANESGFVACFLSCNGFSGITVRKDYAGIDRMIHAVKS